MTHDVILVHPPAIYDFRERTVFYGPVALTVPESTRQFIIPPVGMLSIAEYLDRHGYRVMVDNIGERMMAGSAFDVEAHIATHPAKVFAIGLHWCVHSQGAIEIARLCKRLHPEALVVVGGLTATVFAEEIIRRFDFVDAVIRGEAEKPFLSLVRALEQGGSLEAVPNLTLRDAAGGVKSTPLAQPATDLDEFEYTRLDLLEPREAIFPPTMPSHWSIPISRGCSHNCVTCGGSAYSYRKHLGRQRPAFRSPAKIAADLKSLASQGVQNVFLFQDPRMGGKEYCAHLMSALQSTETGLKQLTLELFGPADEEYIRGLSRIGTPVMLTISPESCVEGVRRAHGRPYTSEDLFKTMDLCLKHGISLGVFSMIALAQDTPKTIRETWQVWDKISRMNQQAQGKASVNYGYGPMILLDPGSNAFDHPDQFGYRLRFKDLNGYIEGMSLPSWHQWISYETKRMDREAIAAMIVDSIEASIGLRVKYGFYNEREAATARLCFVTVNKLAIDVVDDAMGLDEPERSQRLRAFNDSLDGQLRELSPRP